MTKIMTVHSEEVYKNAMRHKVLAEKGITSISAISRGIAIPRSTLSHWYNGRQPLFRFAWPNGSFIKEIPENSRLLSPEKAYIIGVICGDGYASYKDGYVMLETISREFIDEFRRCFTAVYGKNFSGSIKPTCNGKSRIVICGRMATEDIRRYLPKQRSFEWRVPEEIKNSDIACKAAFVKGFFDSEGSVHPRHSLSISCANLEALQEVASIIRDMKIKPGNITLGSNAYRLNISGQNNIVRFILNVGTSIFTKRRKMDILLEGYGISENNPEGES